jgi:hypothetical protein
VPLGNTITIMDPWLLGLCQSKASGVCGHRGITKCARVKIIDYLHHLPSHCYCKRNDTTSPDGQSLSTKSMCFMIQYFWHSLIQVWQTFTELSFCVSGPGPGIQTEEKVWEERTQMNDARQSAFCGWWHRAVIHLTNNYCAPTVSQAACWSPSNNYKTPGPSPGKPLVR